MIDEYRKRREVERAILNRSLHCAHDGAEIGGYLLPSLICLWCTPEPVGTTLIEVCYSCGICQPCLRTLMDGGGAIREHRVRTT